MTTRSAIQPESILEVLTTEFEVPADTSVDTEFGSLDLDSLVLVELAVMLAKQYGVQVDGDELVAAGTVTKVAELLSEKVIGSDPEMRAHAHRNGWQTQSDAGSADRARPGAV